MGRHQFRYPDYFAPLTRPKLGGDDVDGDDLGSHPHETRMRNLHRRDAVHSKCAVPLFLYGNVGVGWRMDGLCLIIYRVEKVFAIWLAKFKRFSLLLDVFLTFRGFVASLFESWNNDGSRSNLLSNACIHAYIGCHVTNGSWNLSSKIIS